ncbi:MAG: hypothetical protein KGH61_02210 [Candidatus Micrarchaeota archaeon]|nr:hypothetical protein [Candidatus Micrarchaeota archaeon]MDE1847742.1 hypothetical protein [Candidatus Micrarchaeota archaeon]MDE1863885.1 hypothetical protein [Candidatus Micrarchaeota archaeon]
MADEDIVPRVEEIAFSGKLTGTLEQAKEKLSPIPFFSMKLENGVLSISRVESRNIKKKPFLFYLINLKSDGVEIVYSIAPDTSEKLRRLSVIKGLASILSIINDIYQIDYPKFMQYVDSSIDDALNSLSQSYSTLFNKYDALLLEYREVRRLNVELSAANRNMTIQTAQFDEENKQLGAQLKTLQTYSDESLMAMVQDWIETHNSSIDITEFAKNYKIPAPRIEQILDKMVSTGYLELKS